MCISLESAEWLSCCASARWADSMRAGQPYPDLNAVLARAREEWAGVESGDVREAVAAHPRIGERTGTASRESTEQAGIRDAGAGVLAAIAEGNRAYEARFGMTYLVRAAGRTAQEMLALLQERLSHDPETELAVAARQQGEITALRLTAMVQA